MKVKQLFHAWYVMLLFARSQLCIHFHLQRFPRYCRILSASLSVTQTLVFFPNTQLSITTSPPPFFVHRYTYTTFKLGLRSLSPRRCLRRRREADGPRGHPPRAAAVATSPILTRYVTAIVRLPMRDGFSTLLEKLDSCAPSPERRRFAVGGGVGEALSRSPAEARRWHRTSPGQTCRRCAFSDF